MSGPVESGFFPRVVLGLVLFAAAAFIALLWMIGTGMADPNPQPSGATSPARG